jgi:predicted nucleic acid-binding protein
LDYVIDANVALKWFFKEKYSENAAVLLKRLNSGVDRVHAPELLLVEVAHVLRTRGSQHSIAKDDVWDQWATFLLAPIEYYPIAPLVLDAFALANQKMVTTYDALYVQLAIDLDRPVVTEDGGIWSNFGPSGRAIHLSTITP